MEPVMPPFSVAVSLVRGVDPEPFLSPLVAAGVHAEIGPPRLQESLDGGSAQVVVLGLHLSRELADTLTAGVVSGVVTTLTTSATTAVGNAARALLQKLIAGVRTLGRQMPRLWITCSVHVADMHMIYNVPADDRDAALTMILDDAAIAITEPIQNRSRFWIYGRWMSGFAPYYEYRAEHAPYEYPISRETVPVAIAEVVSPERAVYSCTKMPDVFIDVHDLTREGAQALLLAIRSRLPEAVAGLGDDRSFIHVEFPRERQEYGD